MTWKKILLVCGVIAPLWYLFMNIITLRYNIVLAIVLLRRGNEPASVKVR